MASVLWTDEDIVDENAGCSATSSIAGVTERSRDAPLSESLINIPKHPGNLYVVHCIKKTKMGCVSDSSKIHSGTWRIKMVEHLDIDIYLNIPKCWKGNLLTLR